MNFQQLKYIIAVDENRHFGKAAKRCHVTPTLSVMIKKLKDELDVTLFDRTRNKTSSYSSTLIHRYKFSE